MDHHTGPAYAPDWTRVRAYLAKHGYDLQPEPPRLLSGGFANLNYLLQLADTRVVLRRPPPGDLPPGAYDMGREHRILSRLWTKFPLAPRGLLLCEDISVLGAPFQLIEYRQGITIRAELPEFADAKHAKTPRELAVSLGTMIIELLASLHQVSPDEVGLETLGRPAGFLERAVRGWTKRARLCFACFEHGVPPLVEELAHWLADHHVPDNAVNLLHNDFKLDNILLSPTTLEPVALVDWDQGTRGDGLFDLATLLSYWTEAGDPPPMHDMRQMPTAHPGFPTREQAAKHYASLMGRDLSNFQFHRVLGQYKTAVIFAQLHARYRSGATADPRYADFGPLACGLLEVAHEIAQGRQF